MAQGIDPIHQFQLHDLAGPWNIAGHEISFTNSALFMGIAVGLVFLFVGAIEIVSIIIRPVTLSIRLFGNIFAGENVLHTMSDLTANTGPVGSFLGSIALPLPFYFMELLVGFVQAFVFTLLCAIFLKLIFHSIGLFPIFLKLYFVKVFNASIYKTQRTLNNAFNHSFFFPIH